MQVTIKIIGHLVYKVGFGEKAMDLPPGTTALELIRRLGLGENFHGIVTRNGNALPAGDELRQDDRIVIAHAYSGG